MRFPTPSDIPPFIRFGIVGGIGTLINTAMLWILTTAGMHYLLASVLATETAIISNFVGNQHYTFKGLASHSRWRTFLRFQAVSILTVVGTVAILALLTENFGQGLLLVWNLIAIIVMFLANYALNLKYTWNGTAPQATPRGKHRSTRKPAASRILLLVLLCAAFAVPALADNVAVNQLGYHPDAEKRAIVYTAALGGSFGVYDAVTDDLAYPGILERAREHNDTSGHDPTRTGEVVACQGGQPCLVADFSDLDVGGTYYIVVGNTTSPEFIIDDTLYSDVVSPVFLEFFNAMLQQGSDYHEDYHAGYDPHFPTMADGSFILVSDQASLPLIRLGSAYRRNPAIFQADTYDIVGEDIPDTQEYIMIYADYLASLQGVRIQERTDGVGFRLNTGIKSHNAFVPGPTSLTQLDIFVNTNTTINNNTGVIYGYDTTLNVVSLCGDLHGAQYNECITYAADVYKCQEDEPCLNRSYISKTGVVTGYSGYNVSRGWQYEFACDLDVDVNASNFNGQYDPCLVFDRTTSTEDTARTMLAYLEALPAVYDYSPAEAQAVFDRAYATYEELSRHHDIDGTDDETHAYWGAALFLLYEYTGNETFLIDAHALNEDVDLGFDTYRTHGNEFYWEEYVRNKDAIILAGLPYEVNGDDPDQFFQNKLYFDYKGEPTSMDQNAERIYEEFRNGFTFSNSRGILIEGLFAAKTLEYHPAPASFIPEIAESQISWVLGRNNVQDGVAHGSPTRSYSFVFGIGEHPTQFHSRYLIDTGLTDRTGGEVVGTRGTSLYFLDPNSNSTRFNASKDDFVFLDAKTTILGHELGASGNGWHNETKVAPWHPGTPFKNGKTFIPGWINGPFDIEGSETDVIFNYKDSLETYEFTESTNEMVAVALEYIAYIDAQANGRSAHAPITFGITPDTNGTLDVTTLPGEATIFLGSDTFGTTDGLGNLVMPWPAGTYNVTVIWPDLTMVFDTTTIVAQETTVVSYEKPALDEGVFVFTTTPADATVYINQVERGNTDVFGHLNISLPPGTYEVMVGFAAMPYTVYNESHTLTEGELEDIPVVLHPRNATLNITSIPDGASITLDGADHGTTPKIIMDVLPDIPHTINITKAGYLPNSTTITPGKGEVLDISLLLEQVAGPPVVILGSSTNVTGMIFELVPVRFDLTLSQDAQVTWTVMHQDGSIVATGLTQTQNPTFVWTPDVFFTNSQDPPLNIEDAFVVANTSNGSVAWQFPVENVINPYFSGAFGAEIAEIHVFTNNHAINFTHVNATVLSNGGTTEHVLDGIASGDEVEWKLAFTAAEGNNNLTRVTGFDSTTNTTVFYDLDPTRRTHYRDFAGSGGGNGGGSGGGSRSSSGGGGGAVPPGENSLNVPQLIYITLTENVFNDEGGTQTVRLDAKATFGGSVKAVTVVLDGPDGNTRVRLSLVNGDNGYGTWEASFGAGGPGEHEVVEVILEDGSDEETSVRVRDRSYYVNNPDAGQELGIIYTLLDQSSVETGTIVTLRLDARDIEGIVSAEAVIAPSRGGDPFTIPLTLVNGDGIYGTWEGSFTPEIADSTYVIKEIHLSRADGTLAIRRIQDREVYVRPEATNGDLLTGNVVSNFSFEQMIKEPLLPTMLAFGAMVIIIAGVALAKRLKGN